MNCDNARDLVLGGYFDGELNEEERHSVDRHLQCCSDCAEFAARVSARAIEPFAGIREEDVPGGIWEGVMQAAARPRKPSVFARIRDFFHSQGIFYVFNALVDGACIVVLFVLVANSPVQRSANAQDDLTAQGADYLNASTHNGYGSAVERYFL